MPQKAFILALLTSLLSTYAAIADMSLTQAQDYLSNKKSIYSSCAVSADCVIVEDPCLAQIAINKAETINYTTAAKVMSSVIDCSPPTILSSPQLACVQNTCTLKE